MKIRGVRVELGEVEAALQRQLGVSEAVVVVREDVPGGKRLVAYVVAASGPTISTAELREHLVSELPSVMVPAAIVRLDRLPITPNGKVDRKALPAPDAEAPTEDDQPRTPTQELLAGLFAEALGRKHVGLRDDFFALGGHSLLATKVVAHIRSTFGVELPLRALFEAPSVAQLAERLSTANSESTPWSPLVPIQPNGQRRPLFLVHPVGGTVFCYRALARYLGDDQPVYGLEAAGVSGDRAPIESVAAMATLYVDAIRRVQATGPYRLGGWSLGGVIAFEMARCLTSLGEKVELVALVDSWLLDPSEDGRESPPETRLDGFVHDLARTFAIDIEDLGDLPPDEQLSSIVEHIGDTCILPTGSSTNELRALAAVFGANQEAMLGYDPAGAYDGRVVLLRPAGGEPTMLDEQTRAWARVSRQPLEVLDGPGDHYSMVSEPLVATLAANLRRLLP